MDLSLVEKEFFKIERSKESVNEDACGDGKIVCSDGEFSYDDFYKR